jgi:hypothetical protein
VIRRGAGAATKRSSSPASSSSPSDGRTSSFCTRDRTGDEEQPGHDGIRAIVERLGIGLTVCGRVHWDSALAATTGGKVLNVDARVVVLVRA